ncbi:hypothetical protein OROGR_029065 [Orobanche gracilis]
MLEAVVFLNVPKMCDYEWKFYDLTLLVSVTTYITSHLFFKETCDLFDHISGLELDEDDNVSNMTKMMNTYGDCEIMVGRFDLNPSMNMILYVVAVLGWRPKLIHVEKCLKAVYGEDRANELVGEVKRSLDEFFHIYKKNVTTTLPLVASTSPLQHPQTSTDHSDRHRLRAKTSLSNYGLEKNNLILLLQRSISVYQRVSI